MKKYDEIEKKEDEFKLLSEQQKKFFEGIIEELKTVKLAMAEKQDYLGRLEADKRRLSEELKNLKERWNKVDSLFTAAKGVE